uniref:Putative monooxygenase p33MONOX n=1 Tax=Felis catus TaxID=9685 RepID=A0ABI7ZMN5_FELCA
MASRQPEVPALEPSGPLGKMSLPIGMYRRAFSYDDALEDPTPMTPPPSDMGSIPWKPVIPERKYQHLAKKLKLQSGEITREEKQPASAQSTPSSTPHSSPKQKSRGWFTSGSSAALPGPNPGPMDSASGDKDRNLADKWSLFGPRSLQKSDSGGFATQAYRGAQKPSPMELIRAQATRMAEDPATFKPPKMDIPVVEGKKQPPRTHNLKPRDLNVLTPTGF